MQAGMQDRVERQISAINTISEQLKEQLELRARESKQELEKKIDDLEESVRKDSTRLFEELAKVQEGQL